MKAFPFSFPLLLAALAVAIVGAEPAPPDPARQLRLLDEALRKAVPALVTSLADKDVRVRLSALYALEEFEELAAPAALLIIPVAAATCSPTLRKSRSFGFASNVWTI